MKTIERLTEVAELHARKLEDIARAARVDSIKLETSMRAARTIAPLLPTGWRLDYTCGQVELVKAGDPKKKNSPLEFRVICDHCQRITGTRGHRSFQKSDNGGYLTAYFCGDAPKNCPRGEEYARRVTFHVSLGAPLCKMKTRKVERPARPAYSETVYDVPAECLGLNEGEV